MNRLWALAHVDVGVLHVAADHQVADRAADRDVGIGGVAIDRERLEGVGIDRDVVHAQTERDIAGPRRGEQHHIIGLAADVEVGDLGVELAF